MKAQATADTLEHVYGSSTMSNRQHGYLADLKPYLIENDHVHAFRSDAI